MKIDFQVILLIAVFAALAFLQIWAYIKLRKQNRIIRVQSDEIKSQLAGLEHQNKLLKELNKEKQQLIGVVSHDLKGPFNRMFALIQMLSMQPDQLTEDQKEYLGKMHQIVSDGLSMVRNLLDQRKLEDSAIDMRLEQLDIGLLLKPLLRHYATLASKKHIDVRALVGDQMFAEVDRHYFTRIVDNLVSNAIKFSPANTTVSISLKERGDQIVFSVTDEGPGLSPEDQSKMFAKYQKLTARPTSGESSTGLGLYIVRSLAEQMGALVACKSSLRQGATFELILKKANLS
ncbi:MAG: sensor histidine kinase [Cyclobacteriaceae bacterium]